MGKVTATQARISLFMHWLFFSQEVWWRRDGDSAGNVVMNRIYESHLGITISEGNRVESKVLVVMIPSNIHGACPSVVLLWASCVLMKE
jgi:hypothetical protein